MYRKKYPDVYAMIYKNNINQKELDLYNKKRH